jgi:hypothetical protein
MITRALAVLVAAAGILVPARASAAPHPYNPPICQPHAVRLVDARQEMIGNSVFGPTATQCIAERTGLFPAFRITKFRTSQTGNVQASPFIFDGCWDGLCTHDTAWPVKAQHIRSLSTTLEARNVHDCTCNLALDDWFSKERDEPRAAAGYQHADGAELMVWLDAPGLPHYVVGGAAGTREVSSGGHLWYLTTWHTGTQTIAGGWQYIQFRLVKPSWHIDGLDMVALIRTAEHYRMMSAGWWLQGSMTCDEIWDLHAPVSAPMETTWFVNRLVRK